LAEASAAGFVLRVRAWAGGAGEVATTNAAECGHNEAPQVRELRTNVSPEEHCHKSKWNPDVEIAN